MGNAAAAPVLEARNIARHFGAVTALADASLQLYPREVVGLVGDNGAGKSTLLKILSGIVAPSAGEIVIDGRPVVLKRAQDAMDAGIETVYQDLALVDTMSAYQNVYLGREELSANPLKRFFNLVDDRRMRERAREVLDALQVKIPSINVSVKGMSGGQRQCLAIARALLWGRRIVILDEPTAALGVRETGQVLEVIRDLRKHDVSVIIVSHNMQQLMSVADRITVMRLGRSIATRTVKDTEVNEIVGLITGAIPGDSPEARAAEVAA
ncbi:ATP-binding cassette domain-containing protein [Devosia sp. ZB163]|uniref:ATP-binding cassette domain-containing protein n=1 Tax=Devosia sp. ZB163 TaxID=3025938 RepID=UPI0023603DFF|nr:ATP-binding cassette domain-containing protein [Devosia sp. ZB163]MDC9822718.1 ATP-binding cassette domain-containing protein [Devosia sp. ZB163]